MKIGKVWSIEAEFEETMSVLEPEFEKSEKLKDSKDKLLGLTSDLKESVADVLADLEVARREFARALTRFSELEEPLDLKENESSSEEAPSLATKRSVKILPHSKDNREESKYEVEYDEEIVEESKEVRTLRKVDPLELGEHYEPRTELPAFKDPNRKFSIWGLIRDNIGRDLTRVTLPIILNEPVTMLQKCAEALTNYELLEKASIEEDSAMKLAYVSIFKTVVYCSIPNRTLKPFNPLLGETYEYVTKNFKFLSEQVSHHPPISASHTYGRGYEYFTHTEMKSKFRGGSMAFIPQGKSFFIVGEDKYISDLPQTTANNLVFGTLYLDLGGDTTTTNLTTGAQ